MGIGSEDQPLHEWYFYSLILMKAEKMPIKYLKLYEILGNIAQLTLGGQRRHRQPLRWIIIIVKLVE